MKSVSYDQLNPVSFLDRSSSVYPDKEAVIYKQNRYTYSEFGDRVNQLANALSGSGVRAGDKVGFLCPNIPAMLEGHYGPMKLGAILVAINIRLSSREILYILNHSKVKVLVLDAEFAKKILDIVNQLETVTEFVQVTDDYPIDLELSSIDYERYISKESASCTNVDLDTELATIAINYTSGTTGLPKGVEYHARGAYLAAMGEALECSMNWKTRYLWTLPMFHCNGWCFTWGVTAVGGTHICLRKAEPKTIFDLISKEAITHMCGAPTILTSMYSSKESKKANIQNLNIMTAGAPPAPQVIRSIEGMGAILYHTYGLTETYGPHTICAIQDSWSNLSDSEQSKLKSRQGVPYIVAQTGLKVVDKKMREVPRDGHTVGEVVMRGNNVMSGYHENTEATQKAFKGDWFHSGDLAVWHADGYIELQDRAKDVIISGGENISSQQVEKVIMEHPSVLEVSVIGVPDEKWGEVPKAFVVTKEEKNIESQEIIQFCRERLAHFKAPKYVDFGPLPKTATGKIQKYVLREAEWKNKKKRIN
ncbi:MAG: acyl-CoA synthetase [Dehalococcoidia bacterium]|nr:acyl-CoA synthetase [Dehalococcoidia bacterium]MQG15939.1 long-chain-fatty-acid--CoA ligase [SAR202 cluster bacterium]|tara:strand:+ start:15398 stop:17002 length:1605 start_codon:yes stop_codon:yes gene_type:complete